MVNSRKSKTFKSYERAEKYAEKIGGLIYEHTPGYLDYRKGHMQVKRVRAKKVETGKSRGWY